MTFHAVDLNLVYTEPEEEVANTMMNLFDKKEIQEQFGNARYNDMMLMTYGAEQKYSGKYIGKVELIRKWMGKMNKMSVEDAADAFDVTITQFNNVISLIQAHPDWDDEQIADKTNWRKW